MKLIIKKNKLFKRYNEYDKIIINNKEYTLYLLNDKYLYINIYNNKINKFKIVLLKDIIYCQYNNFININKTQKVIHMNNDHFNFSKLNLKLVNKYINKNDYNYEIMFKNVNINRIQLCRENDIITLFDRKFNVYKNDELKLGIFIPFKVKNKVKYTFLPIKNIVYFYYNKNISIPKDYKIIYKNGNPNNNSIKNIVLVKYKIFQHEFENYSFRYNNVIYTDYYNIKENDIIPFCNNYYKVKYIKNDLYIKIVIIQDNKNCIKEIPIKNILFEFFNNRLLLPNEKVLYDKIHKLTSIIKNPLFDISLELLSLMNYDINSIKEFSVEDMNSTNSYQGFEEYTEFK